MNSEELEGIPDYLELRPNALLNWIEQTAAEASALPYVSDAPTRFVRVDLTDIPESPLGAEADMTWRKFFLAALVADWACYENPLDKIDFARMKYIMTTAFRTTHLWVYRKEDGTVLPVGSSIWYPIARFIFDAMQTRSADVDDRGIFLPQRSVMPKDTKQAYVLNVSIVKNFRNTMCSRRLIRTFQRDGVALPHVGLMAVTVAAEGSKFSVAANMKKIGQITVQGETEDLYRGYL